MKRKGQIVAWIAIGALALIHLVCFVHVFSAVGTMPGPNNSLMEGLDLSLRRNEAACVLAGVPLVARTVAMLRKTGRYLPPSGQSAYVTHLGIRYRGWPSAKINSELPTGLKAASDGLELVLG